MTIEEALANLQRQNDVVIALPARLVWMPEKIADTVTREKRNASAYLKAYTSMDAEIPSAARELGAPSSRRVATCNANRETYRVDPRRIAELLAPFLQSPPGTPEDFS